MIKDMETLLKTEKKVMQEDTKYVYIYILASEAGVKLLYKLRKSIKGKEICLFQKAALYLFC